MADELLSFTTDGTGFRPYRMEGVRWWDVGDWREADEAGRRAWPDWEFWPEEEWRQLYGEGYRYCALLRDGAAVATAGLWLRSPTTWEVIAVGTAPLYRGQGYAKAVVTFVTEHVLVQGRMARITTRSDNLPMRRVIARLGFRPQR